MISLADFPTFKGVIITQPDGDMGDAPQRTFGLYHVAKIWLGQADFANFKAAGALLQDDSGRLIRDPNKWNDPRDIPADQFDPTVIAHGLYGFDVHVKMLLKDQAMRLGFYPNGNPPNLGSVSSLLRALQNHWYYPLIFFFDFFTLIGALIDCARAKIYEGTDGNWIDMDNAVVKIAQAELVQPTPISWMARKIYVRFYPVPMKMAGVLPLEAAIIWKHRSPKSNPAFGDLWHPIIRSWYE